MKKFALALAAFTMLTATSAMAMDSATLLAHPDRYRVIHADDEEIFYADMKSLSGIQTMDFPGSLENVDFTLYVESLKKNPSDYDFADGNLTTRIREFKINLHADKREREYSMDHALIAMYDAKGNAVSKYDHLSDVRKNRRLDAEAKELYVNLSHVRK